MKERIWDGRPISAPGIIKDMPISAYHSANACDDISVSSSGLRTLYGKSAKHYWDASPYNPQREPEDEDKPHFVMGRAVHHLMLGQPHFAKEFVIQPAEIAEKSGELKPWHGSRTVCKDWMAAAKKAKRTVLKGQEVEDIKGMALSIGKNPLVAGMMTGLVERTIVYRDEPTGLWVKVRPDSIPTGSADFSDLKTTTSVAWIDMMRTISDLGYHQQGALVRSAVEKVLGIKRADFTFSLAFIEKKRPYCVRAVQLKPDDLDLGEKENRIALDRFADCWAKKSWPGPGEDGTDIPYIDLTTSYRERAKKRVELNLAEATDV